LHFNGEDHMVGIASLPELKLFIISTLHLATVIDRKSFLPILIVLVGSLLLTLIAVQWTVDYLLLRRLRMLSDAIQGMEKGDETSALEAQGRDEIGMLMSLFSRMAATIGRHTSELKREVKERTRELQHRLEEVESLQSTLREQAIRDGLTGLYNRRHFEESVVREISRSSRERSGFVLMLLDLDEFKQINDKYGHQAGDFALQQLAHVLEMSTRVEDSVFRWGGEEFMILMPRSGLVPATVRAESMRLAIEAMEINFGGHSWRMTVSIGVAGFPEHGEGEDQLMRSVDAALYAAKQYGRNQVRAFTGDTDEKS